MFRMTALASPASRHRTIFELAYNKSVSTSTPHLTSRIPHSHKNITGPITKKKPEPRTNKTASIPTAHGQTQHLAHNATSGIPQKVNRPLSPRILFRAENPRIRSPPQPISFNSSILHDHYTFPNTASPHHFLAEESRGWSQASTIFSTLVPHQMLRSRHRNLRNTQAFSDL